MTFTLRRPEQQASRGPRGWSISEWADRQAPQLFLMPAVLLILGLSIFPLLVSVYLALSRFKFARGGYTLKFIGVYNFKKLLFGSQQFHFLGTFGSISLVEAAVLALLAGALVYWLARFCRGAGFTVIGLLGRSITTLVLLALAALIALTVNGKGQLGSLGVTLIYVFAGVSAQFLIGLGLAFLCAQPLRGRSFFRLIFFVPLMVTPVGIAYSFRMLADMGKGPFAPLWQALGYADFSWAADAWSARLMVLIGDSWQWIPFLFIVLLAALENQPKDQVEAAQLDGAGPWATFRDITWPSIAPVAATVVLIRLIEAFKIIDLPNVLTNGGPGIAAESMTLHSFIAWRTLDLGGSAAVAYMLLFVAVVLCVSFFNFVGRHTRESLT